MIASETMAASEANRASISRRRWWLWGGVLLLTLLARGGALWGMRQNLAHDPDAYRQLAENVLANGVYGRPLPLDIYATAEPATLPTAYRPPLYPLLLTNLAWKGRVSLTGVAAAHLLLGLLTTALVFRLGELWRLSATGAATAALLTAFDPVLLQQSSLIMTETLATLLAVACLWQLTRWSHCQTLGNALGVGVLVGLAVLCRPTFLPWMALVLGLMLWQGKGWRRVMSPVVLLVALLATLSPWIVRNYLQFDGCIVTTTHGGYTLWLANNPSYYDWLRSDKGYAWPGLSDEEQVAEVYYIGRFFIVSSGGDAAVTNRAWHSYSQQCPEWFIPLERDADDEFRDRAWEVIREQPGMFAYASLVRVRDLWSPLPQRTSPSESTYRAVARYLVAIWYVGVYLLAIFGLARLRGSLLRSPWVWGLTLCLVVTAVHTIYWSNLRMRAPVIPVVALLAAAGVASRGALPRGEAGG